MTVTHFEVAIIYNILLYTYRTGWVNVTDLGQSSRSARQVPSHHLRLWCSHRLPFSRVWQSGGVELVLSLPQFWHQFTVWMLKFQRLDSVELVKLRLNQLFVYWAGMSRYERVWFGVGRTAEGLSQGSIKVLLGASGPRSSVRPFRTFFPSLLFIHSDVHWSWRNVSLETDYSLGFACKGNRHLTKAHTNITI